MSSSVLSNRYRVLSVLGDGGFGKTFLVEDTQMPSSRRCVLKQLKPIHEATPELNQLVQDRFQREAATLEMLGEAHGQIPCLYAYFSEVEQFYLVQEWINGVTVAQKVRESGAQSEQMVKTVVTELLDAIAYIHSKGIVHRDIKPDNIILRSRDGKPVLIDFGAVKETMNTVINSEAYSTRSIVVGTPGYMPVEQLAGRPVYASDIYSLGMTAIYMLTGQLPQKIESDPASGKLLWHKYAPDISPEFAAILDQSIETNTHARFASVQAMQSALAGLSLASDPTQVNLAPDFRTTDQAQQMYGQQTYRQPVETSGASDAIATAPTEIARDTYAQTPQTANQPVSSSSSSSKGALIVGGLVGASVLAGAFIVVSNLPRSPEPFPDTPPVSTLEAPLSETPDVPVNAPDPEPVVPLESTEPPLVPDSQPSASAWEFMGTASSGEGVSVNANSIRPTGDGIDFEYRIGDELIVASADCFENRWYAEKYGWYSPQSDATQTMLNFVCQ